MYVCMYVCLLSCAYYGLFVCVMVLMCVYLNVCVCLCVFLIVGGKSGERILKIEIFVCSCENLFDFKYVLCV